jgi:hypothetical protein
MSENVSSEQLRALLLCNKFSPKYLEPAQLPWLMGSAFVIMALMSFGIGANDAANSVQLTRSSRPFLTWRFNTLNEYMLAQSVAMRDNDVVVCCRLGY